MIKGHIVSAIKEYLNYLPTPGQEALINAIAEFVLAIKKKEILLVKGFAGAGKTSTISAMVKALCKFNINTVLLAPTGRAAKVFSGYAQKNAYTIHKKIYRQKSSKDGFGEFVLDRNLHSQTFFIVDEASMISNTLHEYAVFGSGRLLDDLIQYVFNDKNCKLIIIGDTAQLSPVGLDISPALNKSILGSYNAEVFEVFLSDVIRQARDSGILYNAANLRKCIDSKKGSFPQLSLDGFSDIKKISGEDLIEAISDSFNKYGIEETIVISRSNKRANIYNQGIRNQVLWKEEEISVGDYLMVVKNNYYWFNDQNIDFIANGDIMQVVKIHGYQQNYGFRYADVTLRFTDYSNTELKVKIMLDTLSIDTAALNTEDNKKLFYAVLEEYKDLNPKKKQFEQVKSNPYFNALQVKFAYAVTCHKAQGGQWKAVFIDQGYLDESMLNTEYLRWLYTALTRSTENVFFVNFRDEFFSEGT